MIHTSLSVISEYTLSSRIYPEPDDRQLTLFSQNGHAIFNNGHAWPLAAN
ncbi:GH32 C-terminal domain-containing protein [Citrobacter freundii]